MQKNLHFVVYIERKEIVDSGRLVAERKVLGKHDNHAIKFFDFFMIVQKQMYIAYLPYEH